MQTPLGRGFDCSPHHAGIQFAIPFPLSSLSTRPAIASGIGTGIWVTNGSQETFRLHPLEGQAELRVSPKTSPAGTIQNAVLVLPLPQVDLAKVAQLKTLEPQECLVLVREINGQYWIMGTPELPARVYFDRYSGRGFSDSSGPSMYCSWDSINGPARWAPPEGVDMDTIGTAPDEES